MYDQAPKLWEQLPSDIKIGYLELFATGASALDVGAGRGFYAAALAQHGLRTIALDMNDLRARGNGPSSPLVLGRAQDLPFRSASFDTVVAFDVIEHIDNDRAALAELARVARRRLILSVPNRHPECLTAYNLTFKHHIDKTHRREYDREGLAALLAHAGLAVVHCALEGPVSPALIAEFLPAKPLVRRVIDRLRRHGVLRNPYLFADIYAVADK